MSGITDLYIIDLLHYRPMGFKGHGGVVVKVSASCPKDREFEPHQGHDHVSP